MLSASDTSDEDFVTMGQEQSAQRLNRQDSFVGDGHRLSLNRHHQRLAHPLPVANHHPIHN
jgi:hypothetical protein